MMLYVALIISLFLCACGKDSGTNANSSGSESVTASQSSRSEKYTYEFQLNGCTTGKQEFDSLSALCDGLGDENRNQSCARDLRQEYFLKQCPGRAWVVGDPSFKNDNIASIGVLESSSSNSNSSVAKSLTRTNSIKTDPAQREEYAKLMVESYFGGSRLKKYLPVKNKKFSEAVAQLEIEEVKFYSGGGISESSLGQCTGFLIAPDILATNRHCLPEAIQKQGASCYSYIYALFPKVGSTEAEAIACKEVISLSSVHQRHLGPDYAFLRLDKKSTRKPFEISKAGFADGLQTEVFTFNNIKENSKIKADTYHCEVTQNTYTMPWFDQPLRKTVQLGHCPIEAGNSGSPIVGPDGRVLGIIGGQFSPEGLYEIQNLLLPGNQLSGSLDYQGWATNFACVALPFLPEFDGTIPAECSESEKLKTRMDLLSSYQEKAETEFKQWRDENPEIVWKLILGPSDEFPLGWRAQPQCFVSAKPKKAHLEVPEWRAVFLGTLKIKEITRSKVKIKNDLKGC